MSGIFSALHRKHYVRWAPNGASPYNCNCRKLAFKKGTLPAKKLEEMGPVIKELK
jgi:hypothetical protein